MKIAHISDIHWRGLARHDEYTNAFELLFKKLSDIKPDVIVNTGDIFHTKTQSISPEVVERMTWMFSKLNSIARNIVILGNHDGNLTNLSRKDIISTIIDEYNGNLHIDSIEEPIAYSRNSISFDFGKANPWSKDENTKFHCFSPFDKDGWKDRIPDPDKINIALFHGSVSGCVMDNGMVWPHGEIDVSDMNIYDFVLLGDIHQQQFMDYRLDKNGVRKPYMGYPGSLIQQNFGESIEKGFYVWDIRAKDDWDVEFVQLDNLQPFYTFSWVNNVKETIENVIENVPNKTILPGTRFRFVTREIIPQAHTEALVTILKTNFLCQEVVFKHEKESDSIAIALEHERNTKKNLRSDPDTLLKLYDTFLTTQNQNIALTDQQKDKAHELIKDYLEQYNNLPNIEIAAVVNTQQWSIKWLEFGNLFRYGDSNRIDFEFQNGIVGLFGKNKIGKSSVIAAIMYALYNTTDRGSLKSSDIINKRKNNCWAKICFVHDGTEYLIERETTRTSTKDPSKSATKVNFFEMKKKPDGRPLKVERNSISRDETDKEIRKLIGTPEDFLMTSLASQGDIMRFINEGSTNRKKILNRFLDIDLFEKLFVFVKNDITNLNAKTKGLTLDDLFKKEIEITTEIERINYQIDNTKLLRAKKQKIADELKNLVSSYENKNKDSILLETSLVAKQKALTKADENLQLLRDKVSTVEKQIEDLTIKSQETDAIIKSTNINSLKEKQQFIQTKNSFLKDLSSSLVLELKTKEHLEKSVKKLDLVPCGDEYPECFFIKDSHEDKKKLETQNLILLSLYKEQEVLTEQLADYANQKIDEQIKQYETCLFNLNKMLEQIESLNVVKQSKINEINLSISFKETIEKEIKEIEEHVQGKNINKEKEKYKSNKQSVLSAEEELKQYDSSLQDLYKNLGFSQANHESIILNKNLLLDLNDKFSIYSSIQEAFSKTGIPAMILKTQLPYINEELEKILMGVTDFKIVLENDLSTNAMDIFLEDIHSRRIVELGSGMEKTIASLAIRVALINVSSIPRSDIFIVDEGFTALDEDNMQSCLEMLNVLRNYFKSVLIISHEPAIKEIADTILEVKNNGIESKIMA